MDNLPFVSILINNYNYAGFVDQAIDSALNQTYDRVEVIVVDDGSKDHSREIIARYKDRITPVFKENGGQSSAFNAGFHASQGDIICFLDADDYCFPEKASQVVEQLQNHPDAGWFFHRLQRVDTTGEPLNPHREANHAELSLLDLRSQILRGQAVQTIFPATSGLCFKREILQQTLPMPEQLRLSADNFLRLSAAYLSPGLLSETELAVHRIHGSNAYESGKNTAYLHAETNIQTSYHLRKRFPETAAFTKQLFSHSLGQVAGHSGINKASQIAESNEYLKTFFTPSDWIAYSPRILYNYAKSVINRN
ncbi:MAG TPA: glycosyltransferase [Leptolyngbya sp.]|jgi:glycosyltransferase involved in cell wall biosynthesis|nr:glycosyltransferase [Leptolyngbya sp.]